jgi:molybdate transport system substrate-binding protein
MKRFCRMAVLMISVAASFPLSAQAAEIVVFCSTGLMSVMRALTPVFERQTGHTVKTIFIGTGLQATLEGGAAFDVAISQPDIIEGLVRDGKVVAGTVAAIARQGMGVAVRAGAPKPDIGSIAAFRQTMLDAGSIAYPDDGRSGLITSGVLDRLGIADSVRGKTLRYPAAEGPRAVADGTAQYALTVMGNILSNPGLELVGPYPPGLQYYFVLAGGVGADAREGSAGRQLLAFLTSPAAESAIRANGMEIVISPQR